MSNDHMKSPNWILNLFDLHRSYKWFDPCPLNANFDGLKLKSWKYKAFVNPPYSDPEPWIDKAIEQHKLGVTVVLLLPCDVSTGWFRKLKSAGAHILFPNERLAFGGLKEKARWSSMLMILGDDEE